MRAAARHPDRAHDRAGRLRRPLVLLMAVATGIAVANLYYAQPLLPDIGRGLGLRPASAGLIVTVSQVGFASGLFFLLPLGDLVDRRRLVGALAVACAAALCLFGAAPDTAALFVGAFLVGATSVLAQILVPFAATLAAPEERGKVVGTVMSGLLVGILCARTVSGALAAGGDWRLVYFVAAGAMVLLAGVLLRSLPTQKVRAALGYRALLTSTLRLYRDEPVLRRRSVYAFCGFGTFNVLWTSIAFLLSRTYHDSSLVIGLFGLIGAAGALSANLAGRLSDRRRTRLVTGTAVALLALSWAATYAGASALGALIVGMIVLDVGTQALHITNQGEIYRLDPAARSRLTAAYMIANFAGGALGSASSAALYARAGWHGVSLLGAAVALAAVGVFTAARLREHWRAPAPAESAEAPA